MGAIASFILLATAFPSSPQVYAPPAPAPVQRVPGFTPNAVKREVQQIQHEIREGREGEQLTGKQARELRREANEIGALEDRYSQGGLSDSERAELRNRTEVLRAITNAKRSGSIK